MQKSVGKDPELISTQMKVLDFYRYSSDYNVPKEIKCAQTNENFKVPH